MSLRFIIPAAVIIVALSVLTIQRNRVWKDSETLWRDSSKKDPSILSHLNLANALFDKGKVDEAEHYYLSALRGSIDWVKRVKGHKPTFRLVEPLQAALFKNLSNLYFVNKEYGKSFFMINKYLEIRPKDAAAINNAGVMLMRKGFYADAERYFRRALGVSAMNRDALYNLRVIDEFKNTNSP